jgi:ATP-dependent RNA helicase
MDSKRGEIDTSVPKKNKDITDDTEMVIESSEDLEIVKSFDDLGLREELLRGILLNLTNFHLGIYAYGFNKPSAVQ